MKKRKEPTPPNFSSFEDKLALHVWFTCATTSCLQIGDRLLSFALSELICSATCISEECHVPRDSSACGRTGCGWTDAEDRLRPTRVARSASLVDKPNNRKSQSQNATRNKSVFAKPLALCLRSWSCGRGLAVLVRMRI
jgi:hypothetical protein